MTLLRAGASVGARAADGSTPLHLACTLLKTSVVTLLLRYGADEASLTHANQTPESLVALYLVEEDRDEQAMQRIKEALARAPADRAWRRRGWLVLTRARFRRVSLKLEAERQRRQQQQEQEQPSQGRVVKPKGISTRKFGWDACPLRVAGDASGGCVASALGLGVEMAAFGKVVARVARLEEDGIFQGVVSFL